MKNDNSFERDSYQSQNDEIYNAEGQQNNHPNNDILEVLNPNHKDPYVHLSMIKPIEWQDKLKVFADPYQYLVCNVEKKDCRKYSLQMIYANLLFLMREWSLLSTNSVEEVIANRDSELQCFQYNNKGKVAIIHKTKIILHDNSSNQYRKGNELDQKALYAIQNEKFYHFIAPSYKFSEILIASNRNSLHLLKYVFSSKRNCFQFEIIKEFNGYNAQIGKFSRDGKYFIFSNNISPKLFILDLFCQKVFERNTHQKSLSHMSFSKSGLNFITTCRETNSLNIYECVLWERMSFKFDSPIFFADFLDESYNQEFANCILVVLQSGEVQILKDMQFNMLNSANRRINFDLLERQQLIQNIEYLPNRIIQHVFIDNILFVISETYEANRPKQAFQYINFNQKESKFINYESLHVHENIRFIVTPNKQFTYDITLYNHEKEVESKNHKQPFFEKLTIPLVVPKQQHQPLSHFY